MLDALFTLFATLLAIGIASSDQAGNEPDTPDFILLYYDFPAKRAVPPPQLFDPQGKPFSAHLRGETSPDGITTTAFLAVGPAAAGRWRILFDPDCVSAVIITRDQREELKDAAGICKFIQVK